jgi:septal ring factor EnvC (AmiA/AmiB activator)
MYILLAMLFFVAGVGAIVFWSNSAPMDEQSRTAAQMNARPEAAQVEKSNDMFQALTALKQSVKELETSRREISDQLDEVKRQLAAQEGERKMLTDQVGALSGRLDSLSASATSMPPGNQGNAPAKKSKSR